MNPMERAWTLLKELTAEQEERLQEMSESGMGYAVDQMREAYEAGNEAEQQARDTKPAMTPKIQQDYVNPLAAMQERKDSAAAVRRAKKEGRANNPNYKAMLEAHEAKYGPMKRR
tara:strand:- start:4389 stop:4733 length:345 start_codon:yes stop_codon:yes gene_type:complete